MKITFLGTSSMVPTADRGHTGIFVECDKEKILFDCGENIQRQMRIAKLPPPRITRIFLSHWHGDHVFGLPGLLENLANNSFTKKIKIYGPSDVKQKLNQMMRVFGIDKKIAVDFTVITKDGVFAETDDYEFSAYFLEHSAVTLGYGIKEKDRVCLDKKKIKQYKLPQGPLLGNLQKGKNIVYKGKTIKAKDLTYVKKGKKLALITDTVPCKACVSLAKEADVVVCESTYLHDKKDVAKDHSHMTSKQAGEIAKKAKAKKLVLTHFSQRYRGKEITRMKKEAQEVFKNPVVIAKDFLVVSV